MSFFFSSANGRVVYLSGAQWGIVRDKGGEAMIVRSFGRRSHAWFEEWIRGLKTIMSGGLG